MKKNTVEVVLNIRQQASHHHGHRVAISDPMYPGVAFVEFVVLRIATDPAAQKKKDVSDELWKHLPSIPRDLRSCWVWW